MYIITFFNPRIDIELGELFHLLVCTWLYKIGPYGNEKISTMVQHFVSYIDNAKIMGANFSKTRVFPFL